MQERLPAGWQRIDSAGPYTKLVKRDAVTVPKRYAGDEPFHRDAVVVVTDDLAGVVKGPGARQSWQVDAPEEAGRRLAAAIDEWVAEGGDPYGSSDLNARLEAAVTVEGDEQANRREVLQ
jgi:hypothetical protein